MLRCFDYIERMNESTLTKGMYEANAEDNIGRSGYEERFQIKSIMFLKRLECRVRKIEDLYEKTNECKCRKRGLLGSCTIGSLYLPQRES